MNLSLKLPNLNLNFALTQVYPNSALSNPALRFFAAEDFWNNNRYTRLQTWQLLRLRVGFGANQRSKPVALAIRITALGTIIIPRNFFSLLIGWELPTWRANDCLRIMVCLCALFSNCVWLQMIFCSCVNETTLFSFLRSLLRENGRSLCNLDSRASQKRKHWGREWSLRFQKIFIKKQTRWSNDKKLWFVSVSLLKYLPQPSVSANN